MSPPARDIPSSDRRLTRRGPVIPRLALCASVLGAVLAFPRSALAQTDEIQVYDGSIAGPGVLNLTSHDNYTPSGRTMPEFPGGLRPAHSLNGVLEWAYGVTPWFEAGLYLPLYSRPAVGGLAFDGFKLRALFVEPDAASRRFVYGVNVEFSVNAAHWDQHRYTQEIRPILGWHLGPIDLIINPILDNTYQGISRLDFAPATRIAWNVSPNWALAAEEYDDLGSLRHFNAPARQSHQLFGVFDYKGRPWSIEGGLGFGFTGASDRWVVKLIVSRDLTGQ